jgi:hypothetical protein
MTCNDTLEEIVVGMSRTSIGSLVDDGFLLYFPNGFVQVLHVLRDGTDACECVRELVSEWVSG